MVCKRVVSLEYFMSQTTSSGNQDSYLSHCVRGRSPVDFRNRHLKFVKDRLRFAWVSPGYLNTFLPLLRKREKIPF